MLADRTRKCVTKSDTRQWDPASRAYFDRKRAEGKTNTAALLCLARRRTEVLYAMIGTRSPYRHPTSDATTDEGAAA